MEQRSWVLQLAARRLFGAALLARPGREELLEQAPRSFDRRNGRRVPLGGAAWGAPARHTPILVTPPGRVFHQWSGVYDPTGWGGPEAAPSNGRSNTTYG